MGVGFVTRRAGTLVKDIAGAEVTLDFSSVTYDGSEKAPKIQSVRLGETELRDMQDYYAVITRQQNAGDYNIIVNGIGEYGGVKQVPWHITKATGSIRIEPSQVAIQGAAGTTATVNIIYEGDGAITVSDSRYVSSKVLSIDPVFSKNSWSQIAEVCAMGAVPESWKIGDISAPVMRNGKEYHWQIVDKNHYDLAKSDAHYNDPLYNGGTNKAALTLIQEEVFTDNHRMDETNSNSCSWKDSEFRTDTLQTIKSELDQDFVAVVRKVVIKTAQSSNDATIVETEDDFFMMSEIEVFGNNDHSKPGEGTYLQYFKAGNSRIKQKDGSAYNWWLRSPYSGDYFLYVSLVGSWSYNTTNSTSCGVVLCVNI